ncbi:non-ribosomal peptide synthetase family protein [Coleofasciculus sp.]|uniref:non-ribosomal peptide synthetase family protein n=1 Tax=Coleofasciculus sp. TaxID=3100458 RepID=UPI003A37FD3B
MQNYTLEGFRLSPQQKHLWSLQQNSFAYRAQCVLQIEGKLKTEVIEDALQQVVNRHEILRTTFHRQPGIKLPIQVIHNSGNPLWNYFNLSDSDPKEQQAKIEELFQKKKCFIFNFEQNSILRSSLISLSATQHILLITLPSLCADSWTLKNVVKELSYIYSKGLKNDKLTDEPVQYIQFSEWQNELLEEDAELGKAYWHKQNLGSLPALTLPFEYKPSGKTEFDPDVYALNIEPEVVANIEKIATLNKTTVAEFLFACWQTLLWRITGQSEIIVSTVFSSRKYEELQDVLGLFAKWLPVHCSFQKDFKFTEVLLQISEPLRNHEKWQEYFLWEDSTGSKDNLVDLPISFEFEEGFDKYDAGEVSFSIEKQYVCFERFKLKLTCVRREESITAEFHYDPELIDIESIKCLGEQFQTLLKSVLKNPDTKVNELEILSDCQRQQLLVEFNQTQNNYPQDKCIHHIFEAQVEKTPNNIAVLFEDQHLTYAKLNQRANQLAHYLQKLGVESEVLVGIYLERTLDIIIAILGILKAGGAYLPLDTALPKEGLAFRLQDAQAPILLTQQSLVEKLPENSAKVVYLDTDSDVIAQESSENPTSKVTGENLVYVLFTSGSTGKPKAVAIEHRQLLNYLYSIQGILSLPAGSSFAHVSTFAADLGNTVIFPSLCSGGCLHVVSSERVADPQALADYCHRHPIDCLKITPSHLAVLLANSSSSSILPRQRLVLGGEVASWDLIEQIQQHNPDCQILNHYGPTEATVGVTTFTVKNPAACYNPQTVPLGRPLANTQVYVLDKRLQPVPIGVPGELYIGGMGLAREYLNRPELTAERFITNPFAQRTKLYKTGDLVRYLPDGNLEFLGRTDHQVKIRGFRVELGEIETLLSQHPGVRQVVVSVWEKEPGNKGLVAYIVANKKQCLSVNELRGFLAQNLSDYMIPSAFVMLKTLPLTPNGKVDRLKLPAPEQALLGVEDAYVAPRTSVEKQLTEIWANLLSVERVGVHDNFFELGGHSLLLTQLLVQVRDAFQVDLSLTSLLEFPTVAGLANKIEALQRKEPLTQFSRSNVLNFKAEAVLDPTIYPDGVPPYTHGSVNNILLTGATGFLGAFLLYELLQQTTANIYCLVRGEKSSTSAKSTPIELGKRQLQSILESYFIWHESFSSRIIPVIGDLSQPLLGLAEDQFQMLANHIDAIYHNGAWVHHTLPYSTLKATNVLGTQEILRLACQVKLKPLHFISTTSVFSSTHHSGTEVVHEDDNLDNSQIAANGYVQSKWVAEKLVTIARDRGLPVCIYRPGRISGHSKTGVFNPNDFLYRLIIGCIQLGSAPAEETSFNIAPIDYVSRAIVYLSRQKESLGKAFHLVNPNPLDSGLLINSIRSLGYPIHQVSYNQWQTKLLNIAKHSPEHALYPLLPFFPARESKAETSNLGILIFDDQNTRGTLADSSIVCSPIDHNLLHTYFSYLISSGSLHPPLLT